MADDDLLWRHYTPVRLVKGKLPPTPKPDEPTEQVKIGFMPLRAEKIKAPFTYAPLPPEFLGFLAQIAVIWGQYESLLNNMIAALCSCNGTNLEPNWQRRLSYDQRASRFDDEIKATFKLHPFIYLHLKQITTDAAAIQIKRNVLLHGTIELEARIHNNNATTPIQTELTLIATGRQKKQEVELRFGLDELESLFYELGHLAGRLNTFSPNAPGHLPQLPYVSWQDIYLVQDLLRKHHPAYIKPNTHQCQHRSSSA